MPVVNSVTTPDGVIRPIRLNSVNHTLPSGPRVSSKAPAVMPALNSVTVCDPTRNGLLLPAVSEAPLVRVAVRITPDSATEHFTPTTVQAFDLAGIGQGR